MTQATQSERFAHCLPILKLGETVSTTDVAWVSRLPRKGRRKCYWKQCESDRKQPTSRRWE